MGIDKEEHERIVVVSARPKKKWLSSQAKALVEMTGLADPEAAMRKLVADLLEEAEQRESPVNLPLVASFRHIVDIRADSIPGPAMLISTPRGLEILVNSSDPLSRQNFSAGHEICHTFFPAHTPGADWFIGHFSSGLEEEFLCDIGASALLLPPALVSARIGSYGCCLDAIIRLAGEFESSIEATAVAWAQASPWSCAIVFFEEKLSPTELKKKDQLPFLGMEDLLPQSELRIAHACVAVSFPFYLPKDKSVSRDGPIYRCMAEERTTGDDILELHKEQRKIYAESIFVPYRKDGKMTNRVVSLIRTV